MISQRVGGFVNFEVTESDQELVSVHKQTINERLGLKCNQYKVVKAWTQVVAGVNRFYNLLGDSKTECSVIIYQSLLPCVLPQVTEAEKGWKDPTQKEEEESIVGGWRQGTVTELDQKFLEQHAKEINKKLKTSFGEFRAVSVWTQLVNGVNRFYHVLGDMHVRISLNFYHSFNEIGAHLTHARFGWDKNYSIQGTEGGWGRKPLTPEDSARLVSLRDKINEKAGYNWKQYKPVLAWVQITAGMEFFYHALTELAHPYSIKIYRQFDGTESVDSAAFGWHAPK